MLLSLRNWKWWLVILGIIVAIQFFYFDVFRMASEIEWYRLISFKHDTHHNSSDSGGSISTPSKDQNMTSTLSNGDIEEIDFVPPLPSTTAPSAKPALPSDYVLPTNHSNWCEITYGPQYLEYIADHHLPYCEAGSRSSMECFRTHANDPLCVAKAVQYDPDVEPPNKRLSLHCQLRNFTTERAQDPVKEEELRGIKNADEFSDYFFSTGVLNQLVNWNISMQENDNGNSCNMQENDQKYTLLVKREGNRNLWHKLMELWQSMITIDALQMAWDGSTKAPFLPSAELPELQVVFEDDEVGPVWDLWGALTGKDPIRLSSLPKTCLGNVILPLAGSSSPFWQAHWEDKDCKQSFLLDTFLRRIYRHLDIKQEQRLTEKTTVTVIKRLKTRRIVHLDRYVADFQQHYPDITIQAIDFAELSLKDQILTMRHSDVLVGVIGAGMTHILFLPKESSVAEIMPPNLHYSGFRNLAKMRGLSYFTTHAETLENWQSHEGPFNAEEEKASVLTERNWQSDEWIYLRQDAFNAVIHAAIQAQLNRGLLSIDVSPEPFQQSASPQQ